MTYHWIIYGAMRVIMKPNRRRFISISATAVAATAFFASGVSAKAMPAKLYKWRGQAMGAPAQISLYATSELQAETLFKKCENEVVRLENIFSLYKPDSDISRLNATGILQNPNFEFIALLSRCIGYSKITEGAFDVTIQPLWKFYNDHFKHNVETPSAEALSTVLPLVGSDKIKLSSGEVSFQDPNMEISLNGVAQGYLTDKITQILKQAGFENMLVSMGETFASGQHENNRKWVVGIESPIEQTKILHSEELKNLAIATSGGYGSVFSAQGYHHLLNPKTGLSANIYSSISVLAEDSLTADMLSTAFYIMPQHEIEKVLHQFPQVKKIVFVDLVGKVTELIT